MACMVAAEDHVGLAFLDRFALVDMAFTSPHPDQHFHTAIFQYIFKGIRANPLA